MEIELPHSRRKLRPGKLICVGRNYAAHAAEMRSEIPSEPMLFLKPSTALVSDGGQVVIPRQSDDVHHEIELVLVIGRGGRFIPEADAMFHVGGYAVGLDMTARDIQAKAKAAGNPWSVAKGFDSFAPLGSIVSPSNVTDILAVDLELRKNGLTVQSGSTANMIFSPSYLIHFASQIFTLEEGDLIFTGTPEGVGPVEPGDVLVATATGLPTLQVSVVTHEHADQSM